MPDRLPPIAEAEWSEEQRIAAQELAAGPRGAVFGPFIPLLRSPELLRRAQKTGEYPRYQSAFPPPLSEFVILLVSSWWNQGFEWHVHARIACEVGVSVEVITAIAEGRRPAGMSAEQDAIHDFCNELFAHKSVSDVTYTRTRDTFGERGVIDLCGLCGYYSMLAMVMNVARTPVPEAPAEAIVLGPLQ